MYIYRTYINIHMYIYRTYINIYMYIYRTYINIHMYIIAAGSMTPTWTPSTPGYDGSQTPMHESVGTPSTPRHSSYFDQPSPAPVSQTQVMCVFIYVHMYTCMIPSMQRLSKHYVHSYKKPGYFTTKKIRTYEQNTPSQLCRCMRARQLT